MRVISRAEWGARSPTRRYIIPIPTPRLWVHHTASEQHGRSAVRDIQAYHMDNKEWSDIAYSFLVDDDGAIYEGRGVGVAGAHTEGDNSKSHAICLMGNFQNRAPTSKALTSLIELAVYGRDHGWWVPTLGGHRDAPNASTACPGTYLYAQLPNIRNEVDSPIHEEESDDMAYFTVVGGPSKPIRLYVDGVVMGFPSETELSEQISRLTRAGYKRHDLTFTEPDDYDRYMGTKDNIRE